MRRYFTLALFCFATSARADIPIASTFAPYTANYPLVEDINFKGSFQVVATTAARNAIAAAKRKAGMLVWAQDTNVLYQLASNLTTWTTASFATVLGNAGIMVGTDTGSTTILLGTSQQAFHNRVAISGWFSSCTGAYCACGTVGANSVILGAIALNPDDYRMGNLIPSATYRSVIAGDGVYTTSVVLYNYTRGETVATLTSTTTASPQSVTSVIPLGSGAGTIRTGETDIYETVLCTNNASGIAYAYNTTLDMINSLPSPKDSKTPTCVPLTCEQLQYNCGTGWSNGCGGVTGSCGSCLGMETCGGGGLTGHCGSGS